MKTSTILAKNPIEFVEITVIPAALNVIIQDRIKRIRQEFKSILNCQVKIKVPACQPEGCYHIQILISLPDRDLTIDREPIADYYQEDPYVAIWSAFAVAQQQIKEHLMRSGCQNITTNPVSDRMHQQIRPIRRSRGYAGG
jgi:ribosome-associated translation inhibitor RaiA